MTLEGSGMYWLFYLPERVARYSWANKMDGIIVPKGIYMHLSADPRFCLFRLDSWCMQNSNAEHNTHVFPHPALLTIENAS
jgi:hypothetical protein